MWGYNRIREDMMKIARKWFEDMLIVTSEDRKAFIAEHKLLPVTWANKWSSVINTKNNDKLFKSDVYQQADIISKETKTFIDIEIRLHRLKDYLPKVDKKTKKSEKPKKSIPTNHFDHVTKNEWIEKEINYLLQLRSAILERLTKSNKKLIEQRQKVLIWYMKKSDSVTPNERRDMLLDYLHDQLSELQVEYNQLDSKKGEKFSQSKIEASFQPWFDNAKKMDARQSLDLLQNILHELRVKTLSSDDKTHKLIMEQIISQVNEAAAVLQKVLAKELKENSKDLALIENAIRKPPKVKSSDEAMTQAKQHAKAMIFLLEKRLNFISGRAVFDNKIRIAHWKQTLSALQECDALTQDKKYSQRIGIFEKPKISVNRVDYVKQLDLSEDKFFENTNPKPTSADKKMIEHLFSHLRKNINNPADITEEKNRFDRSLSKAEFRKIVNTGLLVRGINDKQEVTQVLNDTIDDYFKARNALRFEQQKNPALSTIEVDDKAKICYAVYYAITSKDVMSKNDLLEKLSEFLENAKSNNQSQTGLDKINKLIKMFNRQSVDADNTHLSQPKPKGTLRRASISGTSRIGLFGETLPPPFKPDKHIPNNKNKIEKK